MNLKKLIIYEDDILFDLLDEIKEEIEFYLVKANKENLENTKKKLIENYLVISRNRTSDYKSQLIIDKLPIKIDQLIEKINLKFLQEKFSYQSDLNIGNYKIDLNSRIIKKDNKIVDLTEREINLILFLKNSPSAVKINELQKKVWEHNLKLETHTVETHIYRLRKKIKKKFNDENFILSSKEGYLIN